MKRIAVLLVGIIILAGGCATQDLGETEGVVWDYTLDYEIVAGIEEYDNLLYFADSGGRIYSIWKDTGNLRWYIDLSNENILMIHSAQEGVFVISQTNKTDVNSILRLYSIQTGILGYEKTIPIAPIDDYMIEIHDVDKSRIVIHSTNKKIVTIALDTGTIAQYQDNSLLVDIRCILKGDDTEYFLIDSEGSLVRVDTSFDFPSTRVQFDSREFNGSAIYVADNGTKRVYIGNSAGVDIVDTITLQPLASTIDKAVKYSPMLWDVLDKTLYVVFSSYPKAGIGKYNSISDGVSEIWPYIANGSVVYAPMVYSQTLEVIAFLDDNGTLTVLNGFDGSLITEKLFLGTIDRPFMKIPKDYHEKTIFIPISSPRSIVCYSLDYAASLK